MDMEAFKQHESLINEVKNVIEGDTRQELEEGVFGDIFTTVKLSRAIVKEIKKWNSRFSSKNTQKPIDPKDNQLAKTEFKEILNKVINMIKQSNLSPSMKSAFNYSFLASMFRRLKELFPNHSNEDLKKEFEIPDDIYKNMVSAYTDQNMRKFKKDLGM